MASLACLATAAIQGQTYSFLPVVSETTPRPDGKGNFSPTSASLQGSTVVFNQGASCAGCAAPDSIWTENLLTGTLLKLVDVASIAPGGTAQWSYFDVDAELKQGIVVFLGFDANNRSGLFAVPVTGGNVTLLVDTNTQIPGTAVNFSQFFRGSFHHDGATVVFAAQGPGVSGVFSVRVDGTNLSVVADGNTQVNSNQCNVFPVANFGSPDIGSGAIVFNGTTAFDPSTGYNAIFLGPLTQTLSSQCTPYPTILNSTEVLPGDPTAQPHTRFHYGLVDGTNLVYLADDANGQFDGIFTTALAAPGGSSTAVVTSNTSLPQYGVAGENDFTFSSDQGNVIFYAHNAANTLSALMLAQNGSISKIIGVSDMLDGYNMIGLGAQTPGAQSGTEIAFVWTRSDFYHQLDVGVIAPALTVTVGHSGAFLQGQQGAVYTVTVGNASGAAPVLPGTAGAVTVTDTAPAGMTIVSMAGTGWTCPVGGNTCTRSDGLAAGASYPPVTVTVNVDANAASPQVNHVAVAGGGLGSAPVSATDSTVITAVPALSVASSHSGSFMQGQQGAVYTVTVSDAAGAAATSGTVTVTETLPSGLTLVSMAGAGWTCAAGGNTCTRADSLAAGSAYPPIAVTVNVASNAASPRVNSVSVAGGGSAAASATDSTVIQTATAGLAFFPMTPCRVADTRNANGPFGGPILAGGSVRTFTLPSSSCGIPGTAQAYSLNITVVPPAGLGYLTAWPTGQPQPLVSTLNSSNGAVIANAAIVPAGTGGAISIYVSDATHVIIDINGYTAPLSSGAAALAFYPVTPCRVADTRNANGAFGGPSLAGGATRNFAVPSSACGIPSTALAYSLNVTAVPPGPLEYLSAWPAGQPQPYVSTLNALQGQIVANAAIVPAGTSAAAPGAISVFVSDPSNVILDINGYFAPPGGPGALYFYPVTPCRIADTRNAAGTFGGPLLGTGSTRTFPIPSSGCGLPAGALAYSLNMTVVPPAGLFYLSAWPAGQAQPVVSTLNDQQGQIVANAAIVPAGTSGGISVFVSDATNLIIDVNGYFGQ